MSVAAGVGAIADPFNALNSSIVRPTGQKDAMRNIARHVFGNVGRDQEIDHLFSQAMTYETINDYWAGQMAVRAKDRLYGLIKAQGRSVWVNYVFPWSVVPREKGNVIEWDEIRFDQGIANQMGPLGHSRIYGHRRTRRQETMVYRGAAVFIEANFFTTAPGMALYEKQLAQLAGVTLLTCEYDVVSAILDSWTGQPKRVYQLGFNSQEDDANTFMQHLKSENTIFAAVNKTPHEGGLVNIDTRMKAIMMRSNDGTKPDTWIFPPNMQRFYQMNNANNWDESKNANLTRSNRNNDLIAGENGFSFDKFRKMNVIDAEMYRSTTQSRFEAVDMLTLRRDIGEWYPMDVRDVFPEPNEFREYKTRDRNIQVYNEDHDNFDIVLFRDALKHGFRFSEDGKRWSDEMYSFAQQSGSDVEDIFLYEAGGVSKNLCMHWCDVEQKYLKDDHLEAVYLTIKNVLGDQVEWDTFNDKINLKCHKEVDTAPAIEHIGNEANRARYAFIAKEADQKTERETILTWWLMSKISMDNFMKCCNNNVFVPVNVLLFRPNITYNVSSAILMKAGPETGKTYTGFHDFAVTNNIRNKSLIGHFTFQEKAVVEEPRNIMIAEDIFIQNYVRGFNTNFITMDDIDSQVRANGGVTQGANSMYSFIVPIDYEMEDYRSHGHILDLRGFNNRLHIGDERSTGALFEGAHFYNTLLRINDTHVYDPSRQEKDYHIMIHRPNTLCYRGHYEFGRGGRFTHHKVNTGPLGPCTYAGVGRTRDALDFVMLKELYGSQQTLQRMA